MNIFKMLKNPEIHLYSKRASFCILCNFWYIYSQLQRYRKMKLSVVTTDSKSIQYNNYPFMDVESIDDMTFYSKIN